MAAALLAVVAFGGLGALAGGVASPGEPGGRPAVAWGFYSGVVAHALSGGGYWPAVTWSPVLSQGLPGSLEGVPDSPFTLNVRVTRDYSGFFESEPSAAANPLDPENLVVAAHQETSPGYEGPRVLVGIYYTRDGGDSWEGPAIAEVYDPKNDFIVGDAALDSGADGTFYLAYLSVGSRPLPRPYDYYTALESTIMLGVSSDGGETWKFRPVVKPEDYINVTRLIERDFHPDTLLLDKEYIAVGKSPLTGDTMIVISYTEFVEGFDYNTYDYISNITIKVLVSHDGGRTWIGPAAVSPTMSISHYSDEAWRVVQGSYPAITPNGTIFVAYYDSLDDGWLKGSAAIMLVRSDDGGRTWSEPVRVAVIPRELTYYYTVNLGGVEIETFRWWSSMFPSIAAGPNGTLYIAYAADPDGPGCDPADVYLVVVSDWGRVWSEPVRVNDDPEGSCNAQFFPWVEAGPDGSVHIVWADTRLAPGGLGYDIFYDHYANGSLAGNVRVSDYTSPAFLADFIGDYINLAVTAENVHPVWTDVRRAFQPVLQTPGFTVTAPNTDIFTARLGGRPEPTVSISTPEVPAGRAAWVRVTVDNLPREAAFALVFGNATVVDVVYSDSRGRTEFTLLIPPLMEGNYTITLSGMLSYSAYATARVRIVDYIAHKLEGLEGRVSTVEATLNSTAAELGALSEGLGSLQERVSSLEAQVNSTLAGLHAVEGRLGSLEEAVSRVSEGLASVMEGLGSLGRAVREVNGSLAALGARVDGLQGRIVEIEDAQRRLESGQQAIASRLDALNTSVSSLDSRVSNLEDTTARIDGKLAAISQALDSLKSSISGLAEKVESAKSAASRNTAISSAALALIAATLAASLLASRRS